MEIEFYLFKSLTLIEHIKSCLSVNFLHNTEVWFVGGKPAKFKTQCQDLKSAFFAKRHGYLQATM